MFVHSDLAVGFISTYFINVKSFVGIAYSVQIFQKTSHPTES